MVIDMKKQILLTFLTLIFAFTANAQTTAPNDCPINSVCFSRDEAVRINEKLDEAENLKLQLLDKNQAIDDLRGELNRLRVEIGTYSGELTATKAELIRSNARLDFLIQHPPKKCKFSILCIVR